MSGPQTRLELRQTQRLAISPALQQSVAVLALGGVVLEEMIAEAASENPFLIYTPMDAASGISGASLSAYDVALQTVAATPSLGEHLCSQIALMDLPADVAEAAMNLAYDLDENGFLTQPDAQAVARDHGIPEIRAMQAVRALQACEPAGIGAFSLIDSVRLQMLDAGLSGERIQLILTGLPYFTKGQTNLIGPALGLTEEEAEEITELVRSLDPSPGRAFDTADPIIRVPELVVSEGKDAALEVELVNDHAPRLKIDSELAAARGDMATNHFRDARDLIAAVKYRGKTLLAVGRAVVDAQAGYFTGRSKALAPLTRSAIAERLSLHKSTVGRAIAGKTMLWRGEIIELDSLFPAALTAGPGKPVSSHAAQLAIARLVASEERDSVLSDEAICERLREDGVDISRRTVAKYRKCLNIPSSANRRRLLTKSAEQRRTR
ncbi:RNA polymerase factor sigma-54 [Vannielia sp. SX4]|uniref:RNA polymerase factor sigma-54 n=1 Tax=Vannielia sp. SX4 TaxID=3463852 RepID=UPI0040598F4F